MLACLPACTGSDNQESRTGSVERDSAGVRIITNSPNGAATRGAQWSVEKDLSIGEADGAAEYLFGRIVDLDVAPDGSILVLDQQAGNVRVFDSSGQYMRTFGRPGEGPGELSTENPLGVQSIRVATEGVFLADRGNARITRFALDGTFLNDFPLHLQLGETVRFDIEPGGGYVVHRVERTRPGWNGILRVRADGTVQDTVVSFEIQPEPWGIGARDPQGRRQALVHSPLWAMLSDGRLATARSDVYEVNILGQNAQLETRFVKDGVSGLATDSEKERYLQRITEVWADMLRRSGESEAAVRTQQSQARSIYILPERLPVITGITEGPRGTLWVRRALPPDSITSHLLGPRPPLREFWSAIWDVFSPDGRLLGEVSLPENVTVLEIREEAIYGVEVDELGVQRVVRLRIRAP